MWYTGELVFMSYLPFKLKEDMLFINRISVGTIKPYIELWALENVPKDQDEFMSKHGAPVKILIIDEQEILLAGEEHLGWWDEGEHTDELRAVTLDDINYLLREHEGYIDIELSEDDEEPGPIFFEDKVILKVPELDDEQLEEE